MPDTMNPDQSKTSKSRSKSAKTQLVQVGRNSKQAMLQKAHTVKRNLSTQTKGMREDMSGTIAKGAAGVAVTAGVIAAGAALSKKENRDKVGEGARRTFYILQDVVSMMMEENPDYYQRQMGMKGGASTKKKKTSKPRSPQR